MMSIEKIEIQIKYFPDCIGPGKFYFIDSAYCIPDETLLLIVPGIDKQLKNSSQQQPINDLSKLLSLCNAQRLASFFLQQHTNS